MQMNEIQYCCRMSLEIGYQNVDFMRVKTDKRVKNDKRFQNDRPATAGDA